ncbi:MAG TPA: hypothetical protein VFQ76_18640 [Longimicrobiaceae bacterium]|nr:hypothetical protein [Longimicrobiaceae bacterium]
MGRVLLVLVIAAAALASPVVRAKVQPYAQPALDPVYEWSTNSRLHEIARMIETDRAAGRAIPTPKTFPEFMARRYPGEGGAEDPWGVPYYLKKERAGLAVGSSGRDGVRGTADDLLEPLGAGS